MRFHKQFPFFVYQQELTISVENASVALWDLISRNAVVLFDLCNTDQQLTLAQILIKTLLQAKEGHEILVAGYVCSTGHEREAKIMVILPNSYMALIEYYPRQTIVFQTTSTR